MKAGRCWTPASAPRAIQAAMLTRPFVGVVVLVSLLAQCGAPERRAPERGITEPHCDGTASGGLADQGAQALVQAQALTRAAPVPVASPPRRLPFLPAPCPRNLPEVPGRGHRGQARGGRRLPRGRSPRPWIRQLPEPEQPDRAARRARHRDHARPVAARSLRRRARKRVRDLLGSLPWHYTLDEIGAWLVAENLGVELRAVGYRND